MHRVIISDQGTHFDDHSFNGLLKKSSIFHHLATIYHRQIISQVEVSNRHIKGDLREDC